MKTNFTFKFSLLILLIIFSCSSLYSQRLSTTELSYNNIRAQFCSIGNHFWDFSAGIPKYEVPKGSGKNSLFTSVPWIGGLDNNDSLYLAAERYRENGGDYYWGPVRDTTKQKAFQDSLWNNTWLINSSEIDYHKKNFKNAGYTPIQVLIDWPAMGDVSLGQAKYLAPFHDENKDGNYNPYDGDYPKIRGDQCVYMIFNDMRSNHKESGGKPMGVEYHMMAYAFGCYPDSAFENTIFVHYEIFNRSVRDYHNTYFGLFVDFDLGYAFDDFVGCDVDRNSYYVYNGKAVDGLGQPDHYGANPPAKAVTFLSQELDYFTYFNNASASLPTSDPNVAPQYYDMMRGIWKDGTKMKYGGNAHINSGGTGPECRYMFPGESDSQNRGTGGIAPAQKNWTEETAGNTPNDRRGIGSVGPFALKSGGSFSLDLAYVWARATTGGPFESVKVVQRHIDQIQEAFDNDTIPCGGSFTSVADYSYEVSEINIYPNPCTDLISIEYLPESKRASYEIFSITGQMIQSGDLRNQKINQINVSSIVSGLYFIVITDGTVVGTKKLVKR